MTTAGISVSNQSSGGKPHPLDMVLAAQARFWPRPPLSIGPLEGGWSPGSSLFDDDAALDDLLDYEGSFLPGLDLKSRAAALMTSYSHMLAITVVPAFVGFGIVPSFATDEYGLAYATKPTKVGDLLIDERHPRARFLRAAFVTDDQAHAGHPDATLLPDRDALCTHLRQSMERHFTGPIERLHARSGLSRSSFWRLVGDSVAAVFLGAGQRFERVEAAKAEALQILKHRDTPLANRQLHYLDIVVRNDAEDCVLVARTFRARGGCCRYYTANGGKLCSTCVLHKPEERDRRLLDGLRRRLGLPPREREPLLPARAARAKET